MTPNEIIHGEITAVLAGEREGCVVCADCLEVLPALPAGSVDCEVTDPPYGLEFMGKEWDHGVPGVPFWKEALRVAKPGAFLLAFGGTRTFHRLACAIEDAGWELRDSIGVPHESGDWGDCPWLMAWVQGQGFPKGHDVSKAIDKAAGAEREVTMTRLKRGAFGGVAYAQDEWTLEQSNKPLDLPVTVPATDAAKQWEGWNVALKPAWEPIIVARKPLEGTVAENVQKYGTGALNIDGCRIGFPEGDDSYERGIARAAQPRADIRGGNFHTGTDWSEKKAIVASGMKSTGRWPANLILSDYEEVLRLFPQTKSGKQLSSHTRHRQRMGANGIYGASAEPMEDALTETYGDSGSAARFFYCSKAPRVERWFWCKMCGIASNKRAEHKDHVMHCHDCGVDYAQEDKGHKGHKVEPNIVGHSTQKPESLMRYLCRLVTPPGGIVLDCFAGSGSTLIAARGEGFRYVGIERDEDYCRIARERLAAVDTGVPVHEARAGQMSLFAGKGDV